MNRTVGHILLSALTLLTAYSPTQGATISRNSTGVTFTETTDAGKVEIDFRKCMANNLVTFYSVKLNDRLVNSAQYSDNIGPFLLVGHGWVGGNHLSDSGKTTARSVDMWVKVDGVELVTGTRQGTTAEVTVINELYLPDGSVFAIETMRYLVAGNSIEVWAQHDYRIASPVTVERYYGMQSMFDGETAILAPGSKKTNEWKDVVAGGSSNSINIKSYDAPRFSAFVEKSDKGYQACYMAREDLGKRTKVGAEDVVFIGNSYGKSYHKTIGNAKVQPGETTRWHGVYSWFTTPITDTFADKAEAPLFVYPAYMGGERVNLAIDGTSEVTPQDPSGISLVEPDNAVVTEYYDIAGCRIAAPVPGRVCLKRSGGESTKIIVK